MDIDRAIYVVYPTERGTLGPVRQFLEHYGELIPGQIERTEFGLVFSFTEEVNLWNSDQMEWFATTYVILKDDTEGWKP